MRSAGAALVLVLAALAALVVIREDKSERLSVYVIHDSDLQP